MFRVCLGLLLFGLMALARPACAQTDTTRSARIDTVSEVTIQAYPSTRSLRTIPASVGVLGPEALARQNGLSLVPALNTLPGVRMEERSPGSYRLSIRGSLLRSPFGVRNVKVYLGDFPLTDAGGNTYLNLLDAGAIQGVEVLRGPDGSLFGANTGGVVRLSPYARRERDTAAASLTVGSYGQLRLAGDGTRLTEYGPGRIHLSYRQGNGYRAQSGYSRLSPIVTQSFRYRPGREMRLLLFGSSLAYQTPGGLTLTQMQANPRAARPATATLPGAVEQQAGVRNATGFVGLAHEAALGRRVVLTTSVFGSLTHFENPFITNYEDRRESTVGTRAFVGWQAVQKPFFQMKVTLGLEGSETFSTVANYGNRAGQRDTLQFQNKLRAGQGFVFGALETRIGTRLSVDLAASLNRFGYYYEPINNLADVAIRTLRFDPVLMPRLAASYSLGPVVALRASLSRGYSTPTLAELLPSGGRFNQLQAESGWNTEAGLRLGRPQGRLWVDLSAFRFGLRQAIVRQVDSTGRESYRNGGATRQPGLEAEARWLAYRGTGFSLRLLGSFTYHPFRFGSYSPAGQDLRGNRLTGVSRQVAVGSIELGLGRGSLFVQYTYQGRLPLNDANTAFAAEAHLLQTKLTCPFRLSRKAYLILTAGADNLLNRLYSLGYDLNAVGGRYYNPVPGRTVYGGMALTLR